MLVAVVQVGVVRVPVHERRVAVPVGVRLLHRPAGNVRVPVVLVVHVPVLVLHRLVRVLVLVPLGQVEPEAEGHEPGGEEQARRRRLAEHRDCERGADERGEREDAPVRAVPRWRRPRMNRARLTP